MRRAASHARAAGIPRTTTGRLVIEGDSITVGFGVAEADRYATLALPSIGGNFTATNLAVSGQTVAQMIAAGAETDAVLDPLAHWGPGLTGARNVAYLLGGINDLGSGGQGGREVIRRIEQWVADRRAAGWNRIVLATLVGGEGGDFTYVNATLRKRTDLWDGLADFTDATPGLLNRDATYYQDGTHPNEAGHALMAPTFAAALKAATGLAEP